MITGSTYWWWPKNEKQLELLLRRIEIHQSDERFQLLHRIVTISMLLIFGLGMSTGFAILALMLHGGTGTFSPLAFGATIGAGLVVALLAQKADPDVFLEMAEIFLAVPLSRRSKLRLEEKFKVKIP